MVSYLASLTNSTATATHTRTHWTTQHSYQVYMAEQIMKAQDRFFQEGRPTHVDVGYHYTQPCHVDSIACTGLLSLSERRDHGIVAKCNGSSHGDGIYTAPNPSRYQRRGEIGVMAARLKGKSSLSSRHREGPGNENSVMVVKKNSRPVEEYLTVLQQSCQCLPVFQFTSNMILPYYNGYIGNQIIQEYHCGLQQLFDKYFNSGRDPVLSPSWKLSSMTSL